MQYDIYKYRLSILNLELTNARHSVSETIVKNNYDLFATVVRLTSPTVSAALVLLHLPPCALTKFRKLEKVSVLTHQVYGLLSLCKLKTNSITVTEFDPINYKTLCNI